MTTAGTWSMPPGINVRLSLADEVRRCLAWRQAIEEQLRTLAPGLTFLRAHVLLTLAGGRLRMSVLARGADVQKNNLTQVTDALERSGLVRRERTLDSESDRRGVWIELTPEGRRIVEAMRK